jgi:D-alanyl-D-alanine carboxypeptidase
MVSEILSSLDHDSGINLLTAWIEAQMAYRRQPGLSIALVSDQKLLWAKGFGYADVEKKKLATPKTRYRIASITKLFTATAVMQLRDEGKLSLDDNVIDHLSWFNPKKTFDERPPVKIWHLLTHTSGLPRESASPYWTDMQFPTREEMIKTLATQEAVAPTETLWKYSNLALSVAGEVVQAASGMPYADYVEKKILQPLGMKDTFVNSPDPDDPLLARGYSRKLPEGPRTLCGFTDCKGITPAANITTTVEDLAKFAMLQFRDNPCGGRQILSGSTLSEMHRPHWIQPDWKEGWGIGFNILHINGVTYIGHGGAVSGYRTNLRINPVEKMAVIVFTNANDGLPVAYTEKAFQWLTSSIHNWTTDKPGVFNFQKWHGRYRSSGSDMQTLTLNDSLYAIDPTQLDPAPTLIKLTQIEDDKFIMDPEMGTGSFGEYLVFQRDGKGRVSRVKVGENFTEPIKHW